MRGFLCGNPLEASSYRPPPQVNPDNAPQEAPDDIELARPPADEEVLERFAEKLRTGQVASSRMSLAEFDALPYVEVINDYRRTSVEAGQRDPGINNAAAAMAQAARSRLSRKIRQ